MQPIKNPAPEATGNRAQDNADAVNHIANSDIIKSRSKAINLHCKNCIYDPIGGVGSWREQTKNCTSFSCALWKFRPLPGNRPVAEKRISDAKIATFPACSDRPVREG